MSNDNHPIPRADFISGLAFIGLGLLVAYGSWVMPRLENRGIHPTSVPGLVPFVLAALLAVCGGLLLFRAIREGALNPPSAEHPGIFARLRSTESIRWWVLVALTLTYTLILIGQMPYWLATFLFLWATMMVYDTWLRSSDKQQPLWRTTVVNFAISLAASVAVVLIFQEAFLIRLP